MTKPSLIDDAKLAERFFAKISKNFLPKEGHDKNGFCYIAVIPAFKTELHFVSALSELGEVVLIQKNSTKHAAWLKQQWSLYDVHIQNGIGKDFLGNVEETIKFVQEISENKKVIIMDHGGYFAKCATQLKRSLGERLLGFVEFTDNGFYRYNKFISRTCCPRILSIAHSPLKNCADFSSGETIVYCLKYALKNSLGIELNRNLVVGIIGYGRLGSSIAEHLRRLGVKHIYINDIDPTKLAMSFVRGLDPVGLDIILDECDVIISASGTARALKAIHYSRMKEGVFLATVTSPDDELALSELVANGILEYVKKIKHINEYQVQSKKLYLVTNGEAPNTLIENGIMSPSIYLAKAEYLVAGILLMLQADLFENDSNILEHRIQKDISRVWLEFYSKYLDDTPIN